MNISLGNRTAETVRIYFEKAQTPAIRAVLPQKAKTAEEALEDYKKTLLPGASSYGRTILSDGLYVGDIWCFCIDTADEPNAMLSYCVFDETFWNQGIATEAVRLFLPIVCEKYGLKSIGAFTFSDNIGSIRVLEKNAFRMVEEFEENGRASRYYQYETGFMKKVSEKAEIQEETMKYDFTIKEFTEQELPDVLDFEKRLREEEDVWGWEIDEAYVKSVRESFHDRRFDNSLSLLAYEDGRVVGRIDTVLLPSHFDGSVKAYLDWICVVKSARHQGVGQALLAELKKRLKELGIDALIALTASNDEAQRFYKNIPDSEMHDVGIWINIR